MSIILYGWKYKKQKYLGVSATLIATTQAIGHRHKLHSVHFIELADQHTEVTMALSVAEAESLFQRLHEEKINVFYTKMPIKFGMTEDI